jgi:arylsulfatase A-like enzyme
VNDVSPNVLFVMIDALRADRCWSPERECRTPALDSLVQSSTVFTNAFSTAATTPICTASIFTGTYPFVHGVRSFLGRRLRSELPTLAEAFRAAGYYSWAEVTGPLEPLTGLDRGFDDYRLRDYHEWMDTPFGDQLLEKLGSLPRPWFGFLHLWELHSPRRVTPEHDKQEFGHTAYDRALSSLDVQLARLFRELPPGSAVVLTGDHGEYVSVASEQVLSRLKTWFRWLRRRVPAARRLRRFTPTLFKTMDRLSRKERDYYFSWLGHGFDVRDPLVRVPIVLHLPVKFPEGLRLPQLTSHVDLFPTLASAFELQAEAGVFDGVDLMPVIADPSTRLPDRAVYMEEPGGKSHLERLRGRLTAVDERYMAIRTERYKYVRCPAGKEQLFDLEHDPLEREDVASQLPSVTQELRASFTEMTRERQLVEVPEDETYSSEEQAILESRLRDLGYLD